MVLDIYSKLICIFLAWSIICGLCFTNSVKFDLWSVLAKYFVLMAVLTGLLVYALHKEGLLL